MNKLNKYDPNSLVFYEAKQNDVFTTSKDIAEKANVKHHAIQQLIGKNECDFKEFGSLKVAFKMRASKTNQKEKFYLLNEQQATLLLTYLKNTETVRQFKKDLVRQFYKLREIVREKKTKDWAFQRLVNITTRKLETDQIKLFVKYAKEHGSKHADTYYIHFTDLANKYAQIYNRDFSEFKKLKNLEMVEKVINKEIERQISKKVEYHKAFRNIKSKVQMVAEYF